MPSASKAEIEEWEQRIEEVTEAIQDILQEDPMEALQRKAIREARQREEKEKLEKERLAKIKIRYEPKYYNRFERDDVIDAMLKEADLPSRKTTASHLRVGDDVTAAYLSKGEKISLQEAQRLKQEAAIAVRGREWGRAEELYTSAIQLQPVDESLLTVLYNNRALTRINGQKFLEALGDASFVLQREPNNLKALLRRAVALRHLYRPVEALNDITKVLELEPKNAEGLVQHAWLRKAELELLESNRFLETEAAERAGRLCQLISLLSSPEVAGAVGGGLASSASFVSLVEALWEGVDILHAQGTGACVFFAHRGGLLPAVSVARRLLRAESSHAAAPSTTDDPAASERDLEDPRRSARLQATLLIQLLQILAVVWEGSEISTQMIETAVVGDFINALIARLVGMVGHPHLPDAAGAPTSDSRGSVCLRGSQRDRLDAILQCLRSLTLRYGDLVQGAVEKPRDRSGDGLLLGLWRSPYFETPGATARGWVTLSYFVGWLDALLTDGSAWERLSSAASEGGLGRQLFPARVGDDGEDDGVVLGVVRRIFNPPCLGPSQKGGLPASMRPWMQNAAAELALHLTSMASRRRDPEVGGEGLRWGVERLATKGFTDLLRDAFRSVFARTSPSPSVEDSRLLEALYAVVYNLTLLQPTRGAYVRGWSGGSFSLVDSTLHHLLARECTAASGLTPLSAKMFGVLAKFLTAGEAAFPPGIARGLWGWIAAAEGVLETAGGETPVGLAWEHLEHLTTILAALPQEVGGVEIENAGWLVRLIAFSPLRLTEAFLHAMGMGEGNPTPWIASPSEPVAPSVAAVVAAGNAALLLSRIPPPPTPSEEAVALLLRWKAVEVLLQALRDAHNSAHLVSRESVEMSKEKKTPSGVVSYLQRWSNYLRSTTKNLAIAISRVCAIGGEPIKDQLRELKGFETLLAVQK
ncbi:unnamed protein product [Phytomonas sp. EM1]|nr:unnamed protein product [Phytomonas sp. EM1]|eukprot:CCW60134.1 unnamed protein product [Phytomonas sp. isolate EM1]